MGLVSSAHGYSIRRTNELSATYCTRHAGLICSYGAIGLKPDVVIAFYGMDEVWFVNPTFIGDTIHLEMTVEDLQDKHNGTGVASSSLKVVKQTSNPVIISTVKMLLRKRG